MIKSPGIWLLAITLIYFFSCVSDNKPNFEEQLLGSWEMNEALQSGKPIDRLEGVLFEFGENGKITSNLPLSRKIDEFSVPYTLKKNTIQFVVEGDEYQLDIESISDTLVLRTVLQKTPFKLSLIKTQQSEG